MGKPSGFALDENKYMTADSQKLLEQLKRAAANRNAEVFLFAGDKLGRPSRNEARTAQDWLMLELSSFVQTQFSIGVRHRFNEVT